MILFEKIGILDIRSLELLCTSSDNHLGPPVFSDKNIKDVAFLHYEMAFGHFPRFWFKRIIKESKHGSYFVYFDKYNEEGMSGANGCTKNRKEDTHDCEAAQQMDP